jgi:NAD(P)-dependent dehydrogenase (short-subunit alcohol dehydrogenase family)
VPPVAGGYSKGVVRDVRGTVVVVTGASYGVGRETARAFGRTGASVGLLARSAAGLEAACKELHGLGVRTLAVPTDVAEADQVRRAASRVEEELGPIDVWVNDAMATVFSPFGSITPEEFRRVTEVTYLGAVHGTMAALASMRPRDTGVIVQVGSALAYRAIPLQSAYCGAKHAVRGFTESVRCELLHEGSNVRLTMVQLPALNTPQFDWSRSHMPRRAQAVPPIYQPEVAAEAIVWASRHPRREVDVGGTTVATIVAQKLAPALLDRYLAKTGYDAQQTGAPEDPERPDNLFSPIPVDPGAHGRFDALSHSSSVQWWVSKHRAAFASVAGAALAVAARRTLGSGRNPSKGTRLSERAGGRGSTARSAGR